jgi:hypothetical protein
LAARSDRGGGIACLDQPQLFSTRREGACAESTPREMSLILRSSCPLRAS